MTNVILAEAARDAVLAAVSLARRIPGGAELVFARRDHLDAALATPAHRARTEPYRLIVVGPDLAPDGREEILAAFAADAASEVWWLDANEWTEEGARYARTLCRGGGAWFNRPLTHHPFQSIEAAAMAFGLGDDPFSRTLCEIAEGETRDSDDASRIHRAWGDALDSLADRPHELPESVKPLVHGMLLELGVVDRAEGEAARATIENLIAGSRVMRIPMQGPGADNALRAGRGSAPGPDNALRAGRGSAPGPARLQAVVLVLPDPGTVPVVTLAGVSIAAAGADAAVVLFDRDDRAMLIGRRNGSAPPVSVAAALEAVTSTLPWARRDRLLPGMAVVRMVGKPKDALERLVAGLIRD